MFRIFSSAFCAAVCCAVGGLALWLLAHLELPPILQRHHPLLPPLSPFFRQTEILFLIGLGLSGTIWGASLPAAPISERKWRELEAVSTALAILWGVLAALIVLAAAVEASEVWLFALLAALTAAMARGSAKAVAALARVSSRSDDVAAPEKQPAAAPSAVWIDAAPDQTSFGQPSVE